MASPLKWTNFIRSSGLENNTSKLGKPKVELATHFIGSEAKNFYDSLIAEPSDVSKTLGNNKSTKHTDIALASDAKGVSGKTSVKNLNKNIPKQTSNVSSSLNSSSANAFLKAAQDNDVKQLQQLLEKGCNVNSKDMYGWTALMCAVCNGAADSVKYLLKSGADLNVYNNQQMTALDIAKREKNENIIKLLSSPSIPPSDKNKQPKKSTNSDFFCELCKLHFQHVTPTEHQSSTIHLFNSRKKKMPVFYHIPEHNVGFQMLLKEGWDKEQGLGPSGEGQKFPVKTVLKTDRKGLGSSDADKIKAKARITHFQPYDVSAVSSRNSEMEKRQPRAKTLSKKKKIVQLNRQTQKEIEFRRMFHGLD